ncbi:MAG: 23S rRNA (adenine(2503)-C(2))-methyltransferase RlmN [Phycisphaerae bacterium]|jgi:23S rRNA (adenine2503-C2)-methyltransferase
MDERPSEPTRRPDGAGTGPSAVAAVHLPGLYVEELRAWLEARGEPAYRAGQILDWIYAKGAADFEAMSNLPRVLRTRLAGEAFIRRGQIARELVSSDGTRKLLITWPDGTTCETVWIPEASRNTACLSSQIGCPIGCKFCASGQAGFERNLTAGEIVEQALAVETLIHAGGAVTGRGLTNIVLMGMGEPLANYAEVIKAVRILNAPWGLELGARRITLSTVGLPRQIRRLAGEDLQLNLAVSLHAADDELRQELIPGAKAPIGDVLAACAEYFRKTGREITLEYVLLGGVNDSEVQARRLAKLARGLRCNVNLLRYNPVPGLPYRRPGSEATHTFQQCLRSAGVNAHIRTSRGKDIDAACGQLRRRMLEEI